MTDLTRQVSNGGEFQIHRDPAYKDSHGAHLGRYTLGGLQDALIEAEVAGVPRDAVLWFNNTTCSNRYLYFQFDPAEGWVKPTKTSIMHREFNKSTAVFVISGVAAAVGAVLGAIVGHIS